LTLQLYSADESGTEHAVAADRFAREIAGILTVRAARLRQLNGNPLGGNPSRLCQLNACVGSTTITVIIDNAWCVLE
jgi:hypothetical protein